MSEAEYESLHPVEIAPGWVATAEVSRNSSGDLVVTKIVIEANSTSAIETGIAAHILRSLKVKDLINSAVSDQEYTEYLLAAMSPYDWAEETRITWMAEISGEWPRQGRKPNDESLYAKMAFFYSIEVKENPTSPLQTLAEKALLIKNFAECLDTYNNWSSGSSVGKFLSIENLSSAALTELESYYKRQA